MSSDVSFEIDSRLVNVRLSDGKQPASKACPRRPVKPTLKLGASKLNPKAFLEPKEEKFASGVNRTTSTFLGGIAKGRDLANHSADKSMKRISQASTIKKENDNLTYVSLNSTSEGLVDFHDFADSKGNYSGFELDKQKEDFLKLLDLRKCNKLLGKKLLSDCFSNGTLPLKDFTTNNNNSNQISVPLFAHSTKIEVRKSNVDKLKDKEDFLKKLDLQMVRTVLGEEKSAEPETKISAQERFGSAKSISWKDFELEEDDKAVSRRLGLDKLSSAKSISWKDLERETDILSPQGGRQGVGNSVRYGVVRVADKLGRLAGQIVDSMQESCVDYID